LLRRRRRAGALAADCRPDPLHGRILYLRGTFNDWRADDDAALRYVCDHYELVGKLTGRRQLQGGRRGLVGDADFGAAGEPRPAGRHAADAGAQGRPIKATFNGMERITLTPAATPDGAPTLR
jgi:cyclomaltodextrinase